MQARLDKAINNRILQSLYNWVRGFQEVSHIRGVKTTGVVNKPDFSAVFDRLALTDRQDLRLILSDRTDRKGYFSIHAVNSTKLLVLNSLGVIFPPILFLTVAGSVITTINDQVDHQKLVKERAEFLLNALNTLYPDDPCVDLTEEVQETGNDSKTILRFLRNTSTSAATSADHPEQVGKPEDPVLLIEKSEPKPQPASEHLCRPRNTSIWNPFATLWNKGSPQRQNSEEPNVSKERTLSSGL